MRLCVGFRQFGAFTRVKSCSFALLLGLNLVGFWCYRNIAKKQLHIPEVNTSFIRTLHNRTPAESTSCLVFNRVPRSGGETLVYLLRTLAEVNHFGHEKHLYRTPWNRLLTPKEQKNLVRWCEYQNHAQSYDRHFLYFNFTRFERYKRGFRPIYINLLRDPVDREYSAFLYRRSDPLTVAAIIREFDAKRNGSGQEWYNKSFEGCVLTNDPECATQSNEIEPVFYRAIPYICGQNSNCLNASSEWALQQAKVNALQAYSVLGILEDFELTLKVLEHFIPRYFRNATSIYFSEAICLFRLGYYRQHEKQNPKPRKKLSEKVISKLRQELSQEYEFYNFAKNLLRLQLLDLET